MGETAAEEIGRMLKKRADEIVKKCPDPIPRQVWAAIHRVRHEGMSWDRTAARDREGCAATPADADADLWRSGDGSQAGDRVMAGIDDMSFSSASWGSCPRLRSQPSSALKAWAAENVKRTEKELPLLAPIGLHECRHTFVSLMHAAGRSLEEIGDYVGQSSAYMTDQYRHLLDGARVEAAAALDALLAASR